MSHNHPTMEMYIKKPRNPVSLLSVAVEAGTASPTFSLPELRPRSVLSIRSAATSSPAPSLPESRPLIPLIIEPEEEEEEVEDEIQPFLPASDPLSTGELESEEVKMDTIGFNVSFV